MSVIETAKAITLFIEVHHQVGWLVVLLLAFAESLVVVSLFFPATIILVTFSSFLGTSTSLSFWFFWLAAVLGAFLGDALSFWIGYHFKDKVFEWRWLRQSQILRQKGIDFFMRWGFLGVFIGRFFGPLRAVVPLVAGICKMNGWLFQLANILSALLWGMIVLAPGTLAFSWLSALF